MEVMFYIIAGKFNPSNDDFPVKTLITKDKFADKYAQDCTNLLDQQDIFKIIDKIMSAITNGIECVQPRKSVPEAKPYLDKLTNEPSLLPNHDDIQSIFGKDTRKISDAYIDVLDTQFEVTKAVLNRAIQPNFDVYEMGFGTTDHMGYVFNGVQNTLQFGGCMEVVVGLEIPHETTPLTRTNEIDRLVRMVESTLAQMRLTKYQ